MFFMNLISCLASTYAAPRARLRARAMGRKVAFMRADSPDTVRSMHDQLLDALQARGIAGPGHVGEVGVHLVAEAREAGDVHLALLVVILLIVVLAAGQPEAHEPGAPVHVPHPVVRLLVVNAIMIEVVLG